MRIHLVTHLDNGKGLERDYRLLRGALVARGHEVTGVHLFRDGRPPPGDLAIFLERYDARFADLAPRRWLIPNLEWWTEEDVPLLDAFERVLCKTHDALARFSALTPRAGWLGFLSEDRWDPSIARARTFLHVAGDSSLKGGDVVVRAWERYRLRHPLVLLSSSPVRLASRRRTAIQPWGRVPDEALREAQNRARFHLCPSQYEGWGHALHEGLSVGAAVCVTDAPPMSEVAGTALRMRPSAWGAHGLARTALVSPAAVRDAVERCAAASDAELDRTAEAARGAFLEERGRFLENLGELVG